MTFLNGFDLPTMSTKFVFVSDGVVRCPTLGGEHEREQRPAAACQS